ncbi:MAG: ComF family protein [Ruminococcaceae bacterium]|nr:ComF family protein [Oscillospiraceae bacterium]
MSLIERITYLLFPGNCSICGERVNGGDELCDKCKEEFIREAFTRCPICDKSVAGCYCGAGFSEHVKDEIGGKRFVSLTFYDKTAKNRICEKLIYRLKDRGEFASFFADELAREILSLFSRNGEDIKDWQTTYIPRSVAKFSEKGFDQSEEVAKRLANRLGIKFEKVFFRGAGGTVQKSLGREERRINAEESILPMKRHIRPEGKYIVFDDVITTGASMETAIKLLYFYGAAKVLPVSIAKNLPRKTMIDN